MLILSSHHHLLSIGPACVIPDLEIKVTIYLNEVDED